MPGKKKYSQKHTMINASSTDLVSPLSTPMSQSTGFIAKLFANTKLLYLIVLVLALGALLLTNKSLLVAAVVNGKPIWSWQLNKTMTARFGKQTLEGMISESLIADEARKSGVVVSQTDIDAKQADVLKSLGGNVKLDDLLKYQGMTKPDFDNQIRLQLTVQKILGKDMTITDADVNNFIASNGAQLVATDEAMMRTEARQAILDQKVGEKLQPWFLELKQKAKILRFL